MREDGNRHHDFMMVAWVLRLHRKFSALDRMLALAERQAGMETAMNERALRGYLIEEGIPCFAIVGGRKDVADLALSYAREGLVALVQMERLAAHPDPVWYLVMGMQDGYYAAADFRASPAQTNYEGKIDSHMTGSGVFVLKPTPGWCGDWETMLEAVEGL